MKRILVGFDGSEPSRRAVQMAATIAEKFQATIVLAYAVPPPVYPMEAGAPVLIEFEKSLREELSRTLATVAAGLRERGLGVQTELLEGSAPAARLARYAEENPIDLIVVGSHGRGVVTRFLVGSVSDRLVHIATGPVLVVR